MIRVSMEVRETQGGMWRARVGGTVDGVHRWLDGERVYWRMVDAYVGGWALRDVVCEELQAIGYTVAV